MDRVVDALCAVVVDVDYVDFVVARAVDVAADVGRPLYALVAAVGVAAVVDAVAAACSRSRMLEVFRSHFGHHSSAARANYLNL